MSDATPVLTMESAEPFDANGARSEAQRSRTRTRVVDQTLTAPLIIGKRSTPVDSNGELKRRPQDPCDPPDQRAGARSWPRRLPASEETHDRDQEHDGSCDNGDPATHDGLPTYTAV